MQLASQLNLCVCFASAPSCPRTPFQIDPNGCRTISCHRVETQPSILLTWSWSVGRASLASSLFAWNHRKQLCRCSERWRRQIPSGNQGDDWIDARGGTHSDRISSAIERAAKRVPNQTGHHPGHSFVRAGFMCLEKILFNCSLDSQLRLLLPLVTRLLEGTKRRPTELQGYKKLPVLLEKLRSGAMGFSLTVRA